MKWITAYLTAIALAVFTPSMVAAADKICQGHTDAKTAGQCPAGTYYDIALTTCTAAAQSSCGDRK
ncbi:hypothetical protein GGI13_005223 [Coemansia sp. RSA 455]|nr:hypothetical protein GGI13_005223 [Coemansia sp. RSA 455]